MFNICKRISKLREEKGMTIDQIASLIGVIPEIVLDWENDMAIPDIALLPVIAQAFEISVHSLFFGSLESSSACNGELLSSQAYKAVLDTLSHGFLGEQDSQSHMEKTCDLWSDRADSCSQAYAYSTNSMHGVYANNEIAVVYIKSQNESMSLFESGSVIKALRLLSDVAVLRVIKCMVEKKDICVDKRGNIILYMTTGVQISERSVIDGSHKNPEKNGELT